MQVFMSRFLSDQVGATAIEYGLIAALIAVFITGAITTLGANINTTFFANIAATMAAAAP